MDLASASSRAKASKGMHVHPGRQQRILLLTPQVSGSSLYAPFAELLNKQLQEEGLVSTLVTLNPVNYTNGHKTLITKLKHFGGDQWASLRGLYHHISHHDIIHIFVVPPSDLAESSLHALMMARFFGKYIILSMAGGQVEFSSSKFSGLLMAALRLANLITVQSEAAARQLARHNLPVKVIAPVDSVDTAAPRKIEAVQPHILSFAAAGPDSNISTLLRAYLRVKQKYPRVELSLVGPRKRLKAFEQTVPSNNGTTFFYDYEASNLQRLWQEADVYVNTASDDDLPIGVVQALRAGLPVVTTDTPVAGQVIRDRVDGLIFPANDHVGLADRLIELVEQPLLASGLSTAAAESGKRFSWDATRQHWLSIYPSR